MKVTEYNVGRWCLSEDECIAQGIDFAAYERGVADAAKAFGQNAAAELVAASPAAAADTKDLRDAKWLDPECAHAGACQSLRFKAAAAEGVPTGWNPTDDELTAIYKRANGEDTGKAKPLFTANIFKAMRAMLAASPVAVPGKKDNEA